MSAPKAGNGRNNSWGRPLHRRRARRQLAYQRRVHLVNIDRLRVIKSLLAHGADVNGRNTDMEPRWSGARYRRRLVGATALLLAAKSADVEVMRLLLANGADPKINTGLNITPLMAAAGIAWASNQDRASEAQVLEAVKLLVEEHGLDVNFVADTGETAMHAAAYRGANSVVQYLFDHGAKLDVPDKSGRTPLKIADGRRVRQFVRRASAYGGAAAEARRQGNSVSRSVPERDSGRSVAARGGCPMKRRLMFLIGATCAISVFGYGLRGSAQQAPASAAANPAVGCREPSGSAQQVLRQLPQREGEIGRARAHHARYLGSGKEHRMPGRTSSARCGPAPCRPSGAPGPTRHRRQPGAVSRNRARPRRAGPSRTRAVPAAAPEPRGISAMRSAICWRSRSTSRRCCRPTRSASGSTTTPTR